MAEKIEQYESAREFLEEVRHCLAWACIREKLEVSKAAGPEEMEERRKDAMRRIGDGIAYEYWDIHEHRVADALEEIWMVYRDSPDQRTSLASLKISILGMMTMEWIETGGKNTASDVKVQDEKKDRRMALWVHITAKAREDGMAEAVEQSLQEACQKSSPVLSEAIEKWEKMGYLNTSYMDNKEVHDSLDEHYGVKPKYNTFRKYRKVMC